MCCDLPFTRTHLAASVEDRLKGGRTGSVRPLRGLRDADIQCTVPVSQGLILTKTNKQRNREVGVIVITLFLWIGKLSQKG